MHDVNQLQQRMMRITKKLRNAYYEKHGEEPIKSIFAFGGKPTESIGAFAEYNLRGCHCRRSLAGLCSPCFYSRFPDIFGVSDYSDCLINQIDALISDFEQTIATKKSGKIYCRKSELRFPNSEPIALCFTPVGSFFDDIEFKRNVRVHMLKALVDKSNELQQDIVLYVETHVHDFLEWLKSDTIEELELMNALHLRIVFGFESSNDFARNVLYCKNVKLADFETAIVLAKRCGFTPYAFVFVGLYPMTPVEILNDTIATFKYLKEHEVVPVLMFANVQEYTIGDLLIRNGQATLVNPLTVIDVMKEMLDIFGRLDARGCDAWLIADPVGGPPEPVQHIFSNDKVLCCSGKIYQLIKELRSDHEYSGFNNVYHEVKSCNKHSAVAVKLQESASLSLPERTDAMLSYVESVAERYLHDLRADELLRVKAMLLCEGVSADDAALYAMQQQGVVDGFIHSSNLLLDGAPVNACMMEQFVPNPRCKITYRNEKFYLFTSIPDSMNSEFIGKVDFLRIPDWGSNKVDGFLVSDFLRPHSNHCISVWPNQVCGLGDKRCSFCTLSGNIILKPETVAKMVDVALQYDSTYEVHLSGGVFSDFDRNEDYYAEIAQLIHNRHPTTLISLETVPPPSFDGLLKYKTSGISSVLMNLELADEDARRRVCEGKSQISLTRYFEAFAEAVSLFGRWNVASVLLWGFPDVTKEQVLAVAKRMCEIGVYPVIMPFQPLKGSKMQCAESTNVDSFVDISNEIGRITTESLSQTAVCKFGCINCGACSIENYFVKELKQ
jgi:radical SAM enzyme (TIGR01210 family)